MGLTPLSYSSSLRRLLVVFALAAGAVAVRGQVFISNFCAGTIGEYNLDGTPINPTLIKGLKGPWSLAASDSDLFIAFSSSGSVGKYTFDGSLVNADLITGLKKPTGLALYGSELLVASGCGGGDIGLYDLNGQVLHTPVPPGFCRIEGATTVTAIPEPGAYAAIFGIATLGFVLLQRRRVA